MTPKQFVFGVETVPFLLISHFGRLSCASALLRTDSGSHLLSSHGPARSFMCGCAPWVSVHGQRFPLLDTTVHPGKNNPLMPQLCAVWDDSESREAYCFGCLCSTAPFLWNVGISSLAGIFRPLCEFKGALHNAVQCGVLGWGRHRRARAWEFVHHPLMWPQSGCSCVCVCVLHSLKSSEFCSKNKVIERKKSQIASYWRLCWLRHLNSDRISRRVNPQFPVWQLQIRPQRVGWRPTAASAPLVRSSVSKGDSPGHLGVPDLPG